MDRVRPLVPRGDLVAQVSSRAEKMAPLRQNHTEIGSYEAVPINAVATAGIVNAMNETNDGV